jgi:hypothetical protein
MRKQWLATVLLLTVGGVLTPGIANAATMPTTDPSGSTTVTPFFVVGTGSTDTSSGASTPTPSTTTGPGKDAKGPKTPPAPPAPPAPKAPDGAKTPPAPPAPPAPKAPDGPKTPKAPHATAQGGGTSNAPWANDPSLFGGGGRTWG